MMMINFLKSEVFALFVGGFALGTAALFALQAPDARAEISQKLTSVAAHIQAPG
ncbi:hypothetical protein [Sphingorhabdus sp. Alg239-R122]|uniref:hypothetical protein n=1 Tax=Sphingorhabdus sp. Alg239-R122 TaxID=2305989 RepID=UPI0013DBF818|nr:hypothetical protein [Sphingorhabdus sp. Alg239-R122]